MRNLFDDSYDAMSVFIDNLESSNKNLDLVSVIIDFVTNENSKYNELFKTCYYTEFNLKAIKMCLIYTILSRAYMLNYYDYEHEINESYCEEMLDLIKRFNKEDIFECLKEKDEFGINVVNDFLDFINKPFMYQNKAKELIYEKDKEFILRLNPLEAFGLYDYISSDKFSRSEENIQDFFDIYDRSLFKLHDSDLDNGNVNEALMDLLFQELEDKFKDNGKKLYQFVSYIISNVYESLVIESTYSDSDFTDFFDLIPYFELNNGITIIEKFFQDQSFAFKVIDMFICANSKLLENDLYDKRNEFKKVGNELTLKRLNPYYNEEEIIYGAMG